MWEALGSVPSTGKGKRGAGEEKKEQDHGMVNLGPSKSFQRHLVLG
jgi:hypothetical protein